MKSSATGACRMQTERLMSQVISALEKVSLGELITKPRDSVNLNQSVKELSLF